MEGKVAVIGSADFVMPFTALGVDAFPVEDDAGRARDRAAEIVERNYALVVVAENIAEKVDEVFAELQTAPTPCVVVVPFTTESEGFAAQALADVLRMATGIDIMQEN
ncbi:MAG: hypothetical protein JW720_11810 [Sedimentisphaerales bacterium]|nr:hypothetical protein [Sedimentisphaerales bacterium]